MKHGFNLNYGAIVVEHVHLTREIKKLFINTRKV